MLEEEDTEELELSEDTVLLVDTEDSELVALVLLDQEELLADDDRELECEVLRLLVESDEESDEEEAWDDKIEEEEEELCETDCEAELLRA